MKDAQIKKITNSARLEIAPFFDLDLNSKIEISTKIVNFNSFGLEAKKLGIKIVDLPIHLSGNLFNRCFQYLLSLPQDVEEVWHRDYGEIDSGNIIDKKGDVSKLLDLAVKAMDWELECPRFDKLMLRKDANFLLGSFHFDRFNSTPPRGPSQGTMERLIINLSQSSRFLAVMDIDLNAFPYLEDDSLTKEHYLRLCKQLPKIPVLLFEIPGSEKNLFYGLNYEATKTLHCGIGAVGDKALVLSKWESA